MVSQVIVSLVTVSNLTGGDGSTILVPDGVPYESESLTSVATTAVSSTISAVERTERQPLVGRVTGAGVPAIRYVAWRVANMGFDAVTWKSGTAAELVADPVDADDMGVPGQSVQYFAVTKNNELCQIYQI